MSDHWMMIAEAAAVLRCDVPTLRRWVDAGQLRWRTGPLGTEVLLDVDAAPTIEDLAAPIPADPGRESALALALARTAREDADRARTSLRRSLVAVAVLGGVSLLTTGYLLYQAASYRTMFQVADNLLSAERARTEQVADANTMLRRHVDQAVSDAIDAEARLAGTERRLAVAQSRLARVEADLRNADDAFLSLAPAQFSDPVTPTPTDATAAADLLSSLPDER